MTYYNTQSELLQDDINGKQQPWRPKKSKNVNVADSYKRQGYDKKAFDVRSCGYELGFEINPETGRKYLKSAKFCQKRLCPMCQWRKTIKTFWEVSKVMDVVEERRPTLQPIFLTLAQRNCAFNDLNDEIGRVLKGFHFLSEHYSFREQIVGYFRALEVTYNVKDETWHPHIHAILLVETSYFSKSNRNYITQPKWIHLWRTAMKLDYDPTARIQRVKTDKGKRKAVAEVAKYPLKDSNIFEYDDNALTDRLIAELTGALHRRRLYSFGGLMKIIAKELGLERKSDDLVKIGEDDTIREEIAMMFELYRWDFRIWDYVRRR